MRSCSICGEPMCSTVNICDKCAGEMYCVKGCGAKTEYRYGKCKECEKKWKKAKKEIIGFFRKHGYINW